MVSQSKEGFRPSDVDIKKIAELIATEKGLELLEIRWYASVPDIEDDKLKYMRHMNFLSSLRKRGVTVITRKLQKLSNKELKKKRQEFIDSWDLCKTCKPIVEESFLDISDHHQKEKGIDVWIAIDMVKEAINDKLDIAVLISGDADFVPALDLIKDIGKEVLSSSVPRSYSNELRQKFPYLILTRERLNNSLKDKKD